MSNLECVGSRLSIGGSLNSDDVSGTHQESWQGTCVLINDISDSGGLVTAGTIGYHIGTVARTDCGCCGL